MPHPASSTVNIAFACDEAYGPGLLVAVASTLRHTSGLEDAVVHILDGGLQPGTRRSVMRILERAERPVSVVFHRVDARQLEGVRLMGSSPLTYARLLLPKLLPDRQYVLYLDVDVHYGTDLLPLWQAPIGDCAVAAVVDQNVRWLRNDDPWLEQEDPQGLSPYFNAGVMKINLEWWRQHQVCERALALARSEPEKCKHWDQTVLNHLLAGHVAWQPGKFNVQITPWETALDGLGGADRVFASSNVHYIASPKPWVYLRAHPLFAMWRQSYRLLVSRIPWYALGYRYWALYFWRERIQRWALFHLLCRLLLASRCYVLVPGLTREKLKAHLHE